jgi:hypothetical protein
MVDITDSTATFGNITATFGPVRGDRITLSKRLSMPFTGTRFRIALNGQM